MTVVVPDRLVCHDRVATHHRNHNQSVIASARARRAPANKTTLCFDDSSSSSSPLRAASFDGGVRFEESLIV